MARRRTPAGRRPRRRKSRRKQSADGLLWPVGAFALVVAVAWLVDIVAANWALVLGVTIVLIVGLAGVLLLRRRMIETRRREWLRGNARLERVDRMTGDQFEVLVESLLRDEGFRQVRRIGGSGDGGVDVIGTAPTGDLFVIQCKRWSNSVGAPAIRNLLGALHAYPDHRGVLVTTSRFTAPAREYAASTDLILIDRARLVAWLTGSYALAPPARPRGVPWSLPRRGAPFL